MDHNIFIAALTIWREARGEPDEGMRAVAHIINNRATTLTMKTELSNLKISPYKFYYNICTNKWQFSSITATDDSQLGLYPKENDFKFLEAVSILTNITNGNDVDITNGATHYFNPNVVLPTWAEKMTKVASIGHHDFYK